LNCRVRIVAMLELLLLNSPSSGRYFFWLLNSCHAASMSPGLMPLALRSLRHASRILSSLGRVGDSSVSFMPPASDSTGTIADPDGLDVDALIALKAQGRPLRDHPGGRKLEADAIIDVACDIWIPAARPDVLHAGNVARLQARIVAEGANIPLSDEAELALHRRGVLVLPDFIANAGGVICAAFEYGGGRQSAALAYVDERIRANTRAVLDEAAEADITPRALVVSGITAANKVYDATTVATLSGAATVSPLANDVVTVAGTAVASFADKNVGTAKPVSVASFSFGGADGSNYTAVLPSGLTANITPRTLSVSGLVASDKVYDATTAVTVAGSPAVTPLAQDAVFLNGVFTARFVDKNAGVAKPVLLGGLTLSGADASNYTLGLTGSLTATITPYALALSGITVPDKVYDATTVGSVAGVPVVRPLPGDDVAVSGAGLATFDTKNVGEAKPVTISGFTLSGADAPNYSLLYPTALSASTTPRPIAPTGIKAVDRVADNSNTVQLNTSQAALPGVLPGDNVSLVLNTPFGLVDSPTPGVAKPVTLVGFSLSGVDAPNYSLNLRPVAGGPGVVAGSEVSVTLATNLQRRFEELRFNEYLQAVSDAQEPFRRAMAEALAAGFGKENIRKRLSLGLVFETGLAPPAVENIQPARPPASCTVAAGGPGGSLSCP